jgi:hypothetical protein
MLLLRQESLDVAPEALGRFLGMPAPLDIPRENLGSAKEYSDLYASTVRDVRFPPSTLDLAYGSRFARHFYSPAELEELRLRWGSPREGSPVRS